MKRRVVASAECDLLLLNFSNYRNLPIFPYAFTQVSALARKHGHAVVRADFLHVPPERLSVELAALIDQHHPRVVGLTIRQADSLMLASYRSETREPFFPLTTTRLAIRALRELTKVPILVGGIGFSIHPDKVFEYLAPDYGCVGCADEVIAQLSMIAARNASADIGNLVLSVDDRVHVPQRRYFAPHDEREWDDPLVDELIAFYGAKRMNSEAVPAVPIEVMRGCPFRCYFCVEPLVKGKQWRPRNLSVIRDELEFLISRGVGYFWFVASELNIEGPAFAHQLGELMIQLRERHPTRDLIWSGYLLPWKSSERELAFLRRSGHRIAWNDYQSFSDENLKATRVPYRVKDVAPYLAASLDPAFAPPPSVPGNVAEPQLVLFLGNTFADASTISETLDVVDRMELQDYYATSANVIPAVRVFDCNARLTGALPENVLQFSPSGELGPFLLHPSFRYAPALLSQLGSVDSYHSFLRFISETFLSRAHFARKNWTQFLGNAIEPARLIAFFEQAEHKARAHLRTRMRDEREAALLERFLDPARRAAALPALFRPPARSARPFATLARHLLDAIEAGHAAAMKRVSRALGLAASARSEYRLMEHLYRRYDSIPALIDDVRSKLAVEHGSVELLLLEKLLYQNNVVIIPSYRPLLFGPSATGPSNGPVTQRPRSR